MAKQKTKGALDKDTRSEAERARQTYKKAIAIEAALQILRLADDSLQGAYALSFQKQRSDIFRVASFLRSLGRDSQGDAMPSHFRQSRKAPFVGTGLESGQRRRARLDKQPSSRSQNISSARPRRDVEQLQSRRQTDGGQPWEIE